MLPTQARRRAPTVIGLDHACLSFHVVVWTDSEERERWWCEIVGIAPFGDRCVARDVGELPRAKLSAASARGQPTPTALREDGMDTLLSEAEKLWLIDAFDSAVEQIEAHSMPRFSSYFGSVVRVQPVGTTLSWTAACSAQRSDLGLCPLSREP